jgi:superfamily II DNA/RNA helicase
MILALRFFLFFYFFVSFCFLLFLFSFSFSFFWVIVKDPPKKISGVRFQKKKKKKKKEEKEKEKRKKERNQRKKRKKKKRKKEKEKRKETKEKKRKEKENGNARTDVVCGWSVSCDEADGVLGNNKELGAHETGRLCAHFGAQARQERKGGPAVVVVRVHEPAASAVLRRDANPWCIPAAQATHGQTARCCTGPRCAVAHDGVRRLGVEQGDGGSAREAGSQASHALAFVQAASRGREAQRRAVGAECTGPC